MKLTFLTRYDDVGASSRVRFEQYRASLHALRPDWQITRQSLLDCRYLHRKYASQSTTCDVLRCYLARARFLAGYRRGGVWWLEKELWPWAPEWLERTVLQGQRFVLDIDDAIFHNYDLHWFGPARALYRHKIDRLMAAAVLVTAGNDYIAERARNAGARWVESLPTVIDLQHYPFPRTPPGRNDGTLRIGWIGSPTTAPYLQIIAPALRKLSAERRVRLVAIGAAQLEMSGVEVDLLPWQEHAEALMLSRCDIGVMPLTDGPWERGKCGHKLIQYMACGLPVIGSPVGANRHIVSDGEDGFLAADNGQWYAALTRLCDDVDLRRRLGTAGRLKVERSYCCQVTARRLVRWLHAVDEGTSV